MSDFVVTVVYPVMAIVGAASIIGGFIAVKKMFELVWDIKREVLPNGGSSLRDAMNRVEAKQESIDAKRSKQIRKINARLDGMQADAAAVAADAAAAAA